jgi:hypothetical protein
MVVAAYAGAVALISVVSLLRQSGTPATSTVWAEDGATFYAQALRLSFLRTLFTTYNGYMQLVPRLLAQVARWGPPADAAGRLAVSGAIGFAVCACLVFHMAKGHIASPLLRAGLVAAVVLLPMAVAELLDNTVNLPWWMFFATFWAFVWRPQTRSGRATGFIVCFLATASQPLVALLLPLGALRLLALRHRLEQGPNLGVALGLAYQVVARLAGTNRPFVSAPLYGIVQDYAERTGLSLLTGVRASNWLIARGPGAAVTAGLLIVCLIVASAMIVEDRRVRVFTVAATALSVPCFVVPVWLRGASAALDHTELGDGSRYQAVPLLMLISATFVIAGYYYERGPARAAHRRPAPNRRWHRGQLTRVLVLTALVVLLVPGWAADFRDNNFRAKGPSWPDQISSALVHCRSTDPPYSARVLIDPPGWSAVLVCRGLT